MGVSRNVRDFFDSMLQQAAAVAYRACTEETGIIAGEVSMEPGSVSGGCKRVYTGVADTRYLSTYLMRRARRNIHFAHV